MVPIALRSRDLVLINRKIDVSLVSDYSNLPPLRGPLRARSVDNRTIDSQCQNEDNSASQIRVGYSTTGTNARAFVMKSLVREKQKIRALSSCIRLKGK